MKIDDSVDTVLATPAVLSDIADRAFWVPDAALETILFKAPVAIPVRLDRFWLARPPRRPVIAEELLFVIRLFEPSIRPVAKSL